MTVSEWRQQRQRQLTHAAVGAAGGAACWQDLVTTTGGQRLHFTAHPPTARPLRWPSRRRRGWAQGHSNAPLHSSARLTLCPPCPALRRLSAAPRAVMPPLTPHPPLPLPHVLQPGKQLGLEALCVDVHLVVDLVDVVGLQAAATLSPVSSCMCVTSASATGACQQLYVCDVRLRETNQDKRRGARCAPPPGGSLGGHGGAAAAAAAGAVAGRCRHGGGVLSVHPASSSFPPPPPPLSPAPPQPPPPDLPPGSARQPPAAAARRWPLHAAPAAAAAQPPEASPPTPPALLTPSGATPGALNAWHPGPSAAWRCGRPVVGN
jgi:hypothetical protein